MRVGDAERDSVLGVLQNAYEAGQLDIEEFNERQQSCLEARYVDDLSVLVADLPGGTGWAGGQPAEDWEGWIDFSASEGEAQYNQHVGRMDLATRLLEEEQGEPAPCAVSIPIAPTSRPPPSSRQPELSKAVKNTPGISSIWNSNANF